MHKGTQGGLKNEFLFYLGGLGTHKNFYKNGVILVA